MKVALAILLNMALLAVVGPWLRRQWRSVSGAGRIALGVGLSSRLVLGLLTGQNLTLDARFMSQRGWWLTEQLWAEPGAALQTLLGNELHFAGHDVVFHGMSNTFFFVKILAFLNLASLNTDSLNAAYLSIFSFVGCWQLARAVGRALPQTPVGAAVLAFVLWPSVILWTSGVTKEALVLSSGAWLLAIFIELFFATSAAPAARNWSNWLFLALLAVVHFKMRYFFAVPLLGALVALAGVRALQRMGLARRRWAQVLVMAAVLGGGAWLATEVSVAFRLNKFTNQVMRIYSQNLATSGSKPHFSYPDLQPTLTSIVQHVPIAAANALTRPWLGESKAALYVGAGLENALLLVLLAVALWAFWRGRAGNMPFPLGLALVIHCVVLLVLLGLSSPNLGSLHRYRSGLLPYLVLLLLQNDYAAAALRRVGFGNPGYPAQF